ncbi:uncharacterized protein LOC121868731 [Homarus americanus]|nr:uncharacterized protein LOC121868731 [Homarus americanus]
MERCKAVKITSLANLINVQQSDIRSVNLDPVMQFDFTESRVTDLSVRATDQKCTIINCTINIMRRVVLEGTFSFQVSDSVIDDIVQLNYTSDFDASMMSNVQVGTVRSDGLVVSKGILTLREVTINTLQPRAIIVRGAELRLEDSVINNTGADGIILENGTIDLKNVTIGGFPRVSLRMERASGIETPFSFVFCNGKVSTNWMWIGIVVGFIIGVVVTSLVGFLVFYIKMKTKRRTDQQGMELLQPKEVSLSPSSPALQLSQERQEQDNAHRQNKTVDDINDQDEYDDVTINMTHQSVSTNHPPPPTNHPALPPTNHPALPPKDHPPLPTALPPPRTNHPPPPTNHPPPPTNHPPPPTNYPPPPTNNSAPPPNNSSFSQINRSFAPPAKLSVKPKIPPPLPIRNQPPLDTAPSDDRDALPAPPAPIDDDQDLYDELDEFEVKEKQEASQTSNVTSKPPSFLHTAVKPPLPGEGNNPYPTRPAHGQAAVPKGLPGRPWPLPKQSNKPPPPPAVTKPSPGNSASLSFDDDENLYEEL